MKRFTMFACLALTLVFAMSSYASDLPQRALGHNGVDHGGNSNFAKASRDTVFLIGPWGSGAQVNGQFEDQNGNPAWNGWTHWDITQPTVTHWHISDYNAADLNSTPNNMAAYCGDETIPACSGTDVDGGYGNSWYDILRFTYTVADNAANCSVTVSGVFSHNTEPGYDFTNFRFVTADGPNVVGQVDGPGTAEIFSYNMSYAPVDYIGANQDQVRFEIYVTSDGAWSDADCLYSGNGACQVDDLHVVCSNGAYDNTTDFQTDMGDWEVAYPQGTGDFTGLWQNLEDIDPCNTNYTPSVAFINDGNQVPGVGPSYCINWCYGPGGYIVNTTGGAAAASNPDAYLYNALESPVLTWPGSEYIGSQFTFGVYRHEDLTADAPGIFYTWSVRSAVDPGDLDTAGWMDRNFVYYGGPDYVRGGDIVTDLMEPGLTVAQAQLTCYELGWNWGWFGDDGYPAPYFDNVRFTAYTAFGPGMSTRRIDVAQDNFPAIGEVDMNNLAANNVRFDGSMSKAVGSEEHNIPGDSIVCDVASVRVGGDLVENRLYYSMSRNPVFDSVRDPAWGLTGFVDAQPAVNSAGAVVPGKFAYDLPDSGFLFPGDVLHYYFSATDEVAHADPQTSTLPADLTGFGDFSRPMAYNTIYEVHALPSVDASGDQPGILFWNDFGSRGGENEWFSAFNTLGLREGIDYDTYHTNGPSSGVGNGLGGRATTMLVSGYTDFFYTAGDLGVNTISNGDYGNDASADIQLLGDWFAQYPVDAFFCGDQLVTDLNQAGSLTTAFVNDYFNVASYGEDVRPLINSQATPVVLPVGGNSVFYTTPSWIAYGGCFGLNTFDAVQVGDGAERLARFANPSGTADYNYSAATLNIHNDDRVISMPYDFMFIYTDPAHPTAGMSTRTHMLQEILDYFQVPGGGWVPTDTPDLGKFFAKNYPNPFNPTTKIEFNMPKAGHLTLKIYNVGGQLVKTLIDENRAAGAGHVMWDGTNDQGSNVSSGVYFYEARTAGQVQINKMALVK